ncbi:hypothetical protein LBMAG52_40540 [Planctomycetia bacterium]|nr:hypothetical protein LBMAG52_40540 [Planctomycetia bacterium]
MNAQQYFEAGDLNRAISAATDKVRNDPTQLEPRTLLFELLSFSGELDRAEKQLDVVGQQDAKSEWAVQVYRNVLAAERSRRRLWSDGLAPEFLLDPPEYVQWHLQAINRLREGNLTEANELLAKSAEQRSDALATIGESAAAFQDCDDVLAPVLELIVLRDYVWLPLEQVRELEIMKPERPRDLIWVPVRLVLQDDSQRRGYMPVLYPGTHLHSDDQVKLGRKTDWQEIDDGPINGVGQKMFLHGEDAISLLELGEVRFGTTA